MLNRYCGTPILTVALGLASLHLSPVHGQSDSLVSLRCRIVDDIERQGVSRARVTLSGRELAPPLAQMTDDQGRARFDGLKAGQYRLAIEKAGFFSVGASTFGSVEVPAAAIPVELSGANADLGEIVLVKTRSVSGSVKWSSDEPADRVLVHALKVRRGRAELRPGDLRLFFTNERGEFRLENMRPGRWVVYSYPMAWAESRDVKPRSALPVFYPGSDRPDVSASIDLRSTAEVQGVSMTLRETTGVAVEGIIAPAPSLPPGSTVGVGLLIPGSPAQAMAGVRVSAGERFLLPSVPPGTYTLFAAADHHLRTRTFMPVQVDTEPVKDLRVALSEPVVIPGIVEIDHAELGAGGSNSAERPARADTESVAGIRLMAFWPELGWMGLMAAATDKSGKFQFEGPIPGARYGLTVQAPPGTYVAKVTQGGREAAGGTLSITSAAEPVRVLLRRDGARIAGSVRSAQGKPSPAFVVLAPKDRQAEHRFRTAEADSRGGFVFAAVAPGEYELYAFDRNEEDSFYEERYLHEFKNSAYSLTLKSDESQIVSLTRMDITSSSR